MEKTKEVKLYHALVTAIPMVIVMFVMIVGFGASPQIPLIFSCLIAGLVSIWVGYSWDDVLKGMIEGITDSLEACLILMLIGMLVGTWIACGTVPTMIYYGLMIVSPKIFLPATMLICLLVAFAVGSWGTVGTIGLAFMGIGIALQIPSPLVAGAVISGAYMGEIVSPLSDATNLTSAIVGRDVFSIVKKAMPLAITGGVIVVVMYGVTGLKYASGSAAEVRSSIEPLLTSIADQFTISPLCLIPLVVMIGCILLKVPAIPSMLFGSICGMIEACLMQGCTLGEVLAYSYSGYVSATGNEMIDNLLTAGGLEGMLESISIIIIAMSFGGIMKKTKQMEALVNPVISRVHSEGMMKAVTVVSGAVMNVILPDQYLGVSVPGQMYADEYDKRGIEREKLGATLLESGAVVSPLIPWNTCGIYCMTILGVSPMAYAPYAYYGLVLPVLTILAGFLLQGKKAKNRAEVIGAET